MGTTVPAVPQSLEQKIEMAAAEAAQVAAIFSPGVGAAIQAGVAVEPVISGFIQLLVGIFKHHTSQATVSQTPAPSASAPAPTPAP